MTAITPDRTTKVNTTGSGHGGANARALVRTVLAWCGLFNVKHFLEILHIYGASYVNSPYSLFTVTLLFPSHASTRPTTCACIPKSVLAAMTSAASSSEQ